MTLPIAVGKKMNNENLVVDLAEINHLLIGGSTGQGKTALLDTIILSLLYKKHPSQVKLILVATNGVSFAVYEKIKQFFLAGNTGSYESVITENAGASKVLSVLRIEMEKRYELMKHAQARTWAEYNDKFVARRLNPKAGHVYLPALVLIIDEVAGIIQHDSNSELHLIDLAQRSRAVGINLIISTQRASSKIFTGAIKENFTTRIGFKVPSKIDSNILLDNDLASKLSNIGEAIFQRNNENIRIQCAFATLEDIENVTGFITGQVGYAQSFLLPEYDASPNGPVDLTNRDKLFEDCARFIVQCQSGSTSTLQRKFNLGYNRAGRIMYQLEAAGIVGHYGERIGPPKVFYQTIDELEQFLDSLL